MAKLNKREEKVDSKIKDSSIKESTQRGFHMFLSDIGKKVEEDENIQKQKVELKTTKMFNSINNK